MHDLDKIEAEPLPTSNNTTLFKQSGSLLYPVSEDIQGIHKEDIYFLF